MNTTVGELKISYDFLIKNSERYLMLHLSGTATNENAEILGE